MVIYPPLILLGVVFHFLTAQLASIYVFSLLIPYEQVFGELFF